MFERDAYTPLVALLNLKLRYVGNDKSLLALDTLWDIYALPIYNIKLSRERQADKCLTYPTPEFNIGDKVLEIIWVMYEIWNMMLLITWYEWWQHNWN